MFLRSILLLPLIALTVASANTGLGTGSNVAPSFTSGGDVLLSLGQLAYSQHWATDISAGPPSESGQLLNFIVNSDNPGLFSVQPAISPDGILSFTLEPFTTGSANVTVQLHDNGGTNNGGVDTSDPQTFRIGVGTVSTLLGAYNGLIQPSTGAPTEIGRFGSIAATIATGGKFTAKLVVGTAKYSIKATVLNNGNVGFGAGLAPTLTITATGGPTFDLSLHLDTTFGTGQLTGTLQQSGVDFAAISAERTVYTNKPSPAPPLINPPANLPGKYTALFNAHSSTLTAAQIPQGQGYAAVTVTTSGKATFAGVLADGVKFSCGVALAHDNTFPLFANSLGQEAICGTITFRTVANVSDFDGANLNWVKLAGGTVYPSGWSGGIFADAIGSTYIRARTDAKLPFLGATNPSGNATLTFSGGNLSSSVMATVNIDSKGKLTTVGTVPAALKLAFAATGGFSGQFTSPASSSIVKFAGVVFDRQQTAGAFFLDGGKSGSVVLTPKP
jgi:hypothetical protein